MEDDDELIAFLRTHAHDAGARVSALQEYLAPQVPLARKAEWAYRTFLAKTNGTPRIPLDEFQHFFLRASTEFYLNAAAASACPGEAPAGEDHGPVLYVTLHVPEYPFLANALRRVRNAVLLVAQDADWLARAAKGVELFRFRERNVVDLRAIFRRGAPVAAMLDYAYDETGCVDVPFLGHEARTPAGVFALAGRSGYTVEVVAARRQGWEVLDRFAAPRDVRAAAARAAAALDREIVDAPARWLLWPSVDRRWRNVDYGGE